MEQPIYPVGTYIRKPEDEVLTVYNGPYKLIAYHQGTRRWHWHLIYISHNKQWGFNSRLGRIIREGTYKTTSINCLSCLREYLYSGNGRQVLQDILSDEHIEACKCAGHSCGMDGCDIWTKKNYEAECTEGGDLIFRNESPTIQEEQPGMVDATSGTDERLKYHAKTGKFYTDGKAIISNMSVEKIAILMTEIQISFYFYARTVLSQNQRLWKCLQERLKALYLYAQNNIRKGSKTTSISPEFWYFKNR